MKKVKIMLFAVIIVAIAGGTLAFNTKFSVDVCTRATISGTCPAGRICPSQIAIARDVQTNANGDICVSILPAGGLCQEQLCTLQGFTEVENLE